MRLRPRDEEGARAAIAGVYANAELDRRRRPRGSAAAIYFQVQARRRQEAGDADNAVTRRCDRALHGRAGPPRVGREPARAHLLRGDGSPTSTGRVLSRRGASRAAAERDRQPHRLPVTSSAQPVRGRSCRISPEAQRVWRDPRGAPEAAGKRAPPAEKLSELYLGGHEYAKLAELLKASDSWSVIEDPAKARARIIARARGALPRPATAIATRRTRVPARRAAKIEPETKIALGAYAEHLRLHEGQTAGRGLADLLEFFLPIVERLRRRRGRRRARGAPRGDRTVVCREREACRRRFRPRAIQRAWQRIEELQPKHARAAKRQRRMLLLKAKNWDRMAALLDSARSCPAGRSAAQRNEILRAGSRRSAPPGEKLSERQKRRRGLPRGAAHRSAGRRVDARCSSTSYERRVATCAGLAERAARADRGQRRPRCRSASRCCARCSRSTTSSSPTCRRASGPRTRSCCAMNTGDRVHAYASRGRPRARRRRAQARRCPRSAHQPHAGQPGREGPANVARRRALPGAAPVIRRGAAQRWEVRSCASDPDDARAAREAARGRDSTRRSTSPRTSRACSTCRSSAPSPTRRRRASTSARSRASPRARCATSRARKACWSRAAQAKILPGDVPRRS